MSQQLRKMGLRLPFGNFPEDCLLEKEEKNNFTNNSEEDEYHYHRSFQLGRYQGAHAKAAREMGALFLNDKNKIRSASATSDELMFPQKKKRKQRWMNCNCSPKGFFYVLKSVVDDWLYLALLGIIMAILSMVMDIAIDLLQLYHMRLFDKVELSAHVVVSYLVWVGYVVLLIAASALCAHYVAPQAIGSGIPEMKTILRGVILKEYLSFRTLISKMVALTMSLGTGLPIGKEGPFVHVASVVANLLSHFMHRTRGVFENESRRNEMLAAGCAVGVACTFSAPVGGVLFSIEVTSVYFAVRNYWRGFFAATCSATVFRILRILRRAYLPSDNLEKILSVEANFQTTFPEKDAFLPTELPLFALVGLICGILGALFIYLHRNMVLFLRRNALAKKIFQKYWLIYPVFISFLISSITFPRGLGAFIGGEQKFSEALSEFFADCTWSARSNSSTSCYLLSNETIDMHHWTGPHGTTNIFLVLALFQLVFFCLTIAASTLPVPAGIFMPVFVLGAAFGRSFGEMLTVWFPEGIDPTLDNFHIRPGVYAVVGAAAFCGAVTHTVSVAVIVFELTGQLTHLLPVMIAVLVANAVCSYLQPSIYDSIIKIKHLPYLPDIPNTSFSIYHQIQVEQFMVKDIRFIARDTTYSELQDMLLAMPRLKAFPLVETKGGMTLLGSISKSQLHRILEAKVGTRARQAEATRRVRVALEQVDRRLKVAQLSDELGLKNVVVRSATGSAKSSTGNRFTVVPVSREESLKCQPKHRTVQNTSGGQILTNEEKEAIFAMGKKRNRDSSSEDHHQRSLDVYHTIGGMLRSISKLHFGKSKKETEKNEFDLYADERKMWEEEQLSHVVDLAACQIDPAPFQLVEHTNLIKVHSLFSLLGLNRAYVTECGRLVGVVALREVRLAIEMAQSGVVPSVGENLCLPNGPATDGTDDEDFICPRLEVISASNTVDSLSKLAGDEEESKHDSSSDGQDETTMYVEGLQRRFSSSASDPCLVMAESAIGEGATGSSPLFIEPQQLDVAGLQRGQSDSRTPSPDSRSERRAERRKKNLHVQIVMPDDDSSS